MNIRIVGSIVAVVAPRGREEGQQPDGGDAQILQVIESAGQPTKIAHPVVFAVAERANVYLVDDRVFVPEEFSLLTRDEVAIGLLLRQLHRKVRSLFYFVRCWR